MSEGHNAQHAFGAVRSDLGDRKSVPSHQRGLRSLLPHHHSGIAGHSGHACEHGDDERARGCVRLFV